jgi:O-antigen/teichoic acid export membrane protein
MFVFWSYVISNALLALISISLGWNRISSIASVTKTYMRSLLNFGKFSMGTLIGTNLLRSSDTFIITAFIGPNPVAIYNVPDKLIGLMEIPIRALTSISFPQMAKAYSKGNIQRFQSEFYTGAGLLTIFILPISIIVFITAPQLVVWLGGEQYAESMEILRVFAIYMALVPIERYSGLGLDVINKPKLNFIKVVYMLTVNAIGDVIVLSMGGGIYWVAVISVVTYSSGILFGYYFLRNTIPFKLSTILALGVKELKTLSRKLIS